MTSQTTSQGNCQARPLWNMSLRISHMKRESPDTMPGQGQILKALEAWWKMLSLFIVFIYSIRSYPLGLEQ